MIIVIQCSDKVGLMTATSNVLANNGINIVSMREHVDTGNARFFIRIETEGGPHTNHLGTQLKEVLPPDVMMHHLFI